MKLKVTDNSGVACKDVYYMSLSDFGSRACHPFIATTDWSVIEVDLTEETPVGIIRQVMQNKVVIPIFDEGNITMRVVQLLCEIVPDSAGTLRVLSLRDRSGLCSYVSELKEAYGW